MQGASDGEALRDSPVGTKLGRRVHWHFGKHGGELKNQKGRTLKRSEGLRGRGWRK